MASKRKTQSAGRLGQMELRAITFVATLSLAALAILMGVESAVVWTFLGVAVGRTLPDLTKT